MNSQYLALANQVRHMREMAQAFRQHREAFGELTEQQIKERALFEIAMRNGKLRAKPSIFATLPGDLET